MAGTEASAATIFLTPISSRRCPAPPERATARGGPNAQQWEPPLPAGAFTRNGSGERLRNMAQNKAATLYRMVLPDHTCPFGVRAKELLDAHGYQVEDNILGSRGEVDAFKAEHGLTTTPLVFIGDEQIGGSTDLERYLQAG
jgi:glutaredoxin